MKNNKGITLIALVITIIVLLILAGVSIAMLTGNNGILTQAGNAQTANLKSEAEEAVKMAINEIITNQKAEAAGYGEEDAVTTLSGTNIASVVAKNNAGSDCSGTGEANAERTITYKANANSKSVTVTISADGGTITVGEPQ